jgi:hypothetical protein
MPALMSGYEHIHIGSGLGEAHLNIPWQQYYDYGSPEGQDQLSALLRQLGTPVRLHALACVLPYNLIQQILYVRYPELYAHQVSVRVGERSEKNLHVALLKLYHGIGFHNECSDDLFRGLLKSFVEQRLGNPDDFGHNNHREVINREMMAIIWHHREHPLMSSVRDRIPSSWEGKWIDFVHAYVDRRIPADVMDIYHQYASDYDLSRGGYRIPTPP